MADVEFEDYSVKVKGEIADRVDAVLEEVCGEIESQVKRNSRVDTGKTKNSFWHRVTGSVLAGEYLGQVGSSDENSIWEEFGTGDHALGGDGRKGGWRYEDENGQWHYTEGKKPSRAFWHAYTAMKSSIISRIQNAFKGL